MPVIRQATGDYLVLATAQISALGNNTGATGSAFANGESANLWIKADFFFSGLFGAAPNSGSALELYLLPWVNGTAQADGSSAIFPPNQLVGAFVVRNVTTIQQLVVQDVPLPPHTFQPLLVNRAGQTLSASPHLGMRPSRYQAT